MSAAVGGTGIPYHTPDDSVMARRMAAADRPGEHLWVINAAWQVADPDRPQMRYLDAENLLMVAGPECFKCEREYSRKLAKMRCTGSMNLQ